MFKHIKASTNEKLTYSFIARTLKKCDKDLLDKFRTIFKKKFDEALLEKNTMPERTALVKTLKELSEVRKIVKSAATLEIGNPEYAGQYLANIVRFLLQRISEKNRSKAVSKMKQKIYYLNEYELSSKNLPAGSAMGNSITLLKTVLMGHNPNFIRSVLNNIVRNL